MLEHILVALDGSRLAESALPHAVALAQAFNSRVTLMRVLEPAEDEAASIDPVGWHIRKAEADAYLDELAAQLQEAGVNAGRLLLQGKAAERIVEHAHDEKVDLILVSSHGQSGLSRWNISSVVSKVILRAYTPTMIVRAYRPTPSEITELSYRRLLVPLDGSQRAECVLSLATTLARSHDAKLLLAHVVSKPEVPRRAPLTDEETELVNRLTELNREKGAQYLKGLKSRLPSQVETRLLVSQDAAATLQSLVEEQEIDLVLLSAHGYTGESKWPYGSIALNFIVYGSTPLLIMQDLPREEIERTQAELVAREEKGH